MTEDPGPNLCYCSNVHPGGDWDEFLSSLDGPIREVRRRVAPDRSLGLGLWWSRDVVSELNRGTQAREQLCDFLQRENCRVSTLNGFPYGRFHGEAVKDRVHAPDWTTPERVDYTRDLFSVLAGLVPEDEAAGVSTSPLSYGPWHGRADRDGVVAAAVGNLVDVVVHLRELRETTGRLLHLDLEPEPDGMLENAAGVEAFFENHLLTAGRDALARRCRITAGQAEQSIRDHLRVCFDVCHFSVVYEDPEEALGRLLGAGIGIGKVHLSAALKWEFGDVDAAALRRHAGPLDEPTYLHQVVQRDRSGGYRRFPDLGPALEAADPGEAAEWRTHFHVPLFADALEPWKSTRDDVVKVLDYWKRTPFTDQFEIETYTWAVLPDELRLPLVDSIAREFGWVGEHLSSWR